MLKLKVVDPKDYNDKNISPALQNAVKVLNDALAIDAASVMELLDASIVVDSELEAKFVQHPSIVLRTVHDHLELSALGILAGCVNMGAEYRLYVHEEDDGTWTKFGVMHQEEVE